jgi:hypothetical protein
MPPRSRPAMPRFHFARVEGEGPVVSRVTADGRAGEEDGSGAEGRTSRLVMGPSGMVRPSGCGIIPG